MSPEKITPNDMNSSENADDAEVKRGLDWIHSEVGQAELEKVARDVRTTMKKLEEGNRLVSHLLKDASSFKLSF